MVSKSKFSIVSSFLYREPEETDEVIRSYFDFLISLNIPLVFFIAPEYVSLLPDNIVLRIFDVSDSWITQEIAQLENRGVEERDGSIRLSLPPHRNDAKDTIPFLLAGHTKHELLEYAVQENPWKSTHFAWMDFNISKIVKNKSGIREWFQWTQVPETATFLTMPGCWPKWDKNKPSEILDAVHWRFCGGFLVGDAQSIRTFCELYREVLPTFLREHKRLVWDFNFWAWLESSYEERWQATHYKADHNDSLFLYSADSYAQILGNQEVIIKKTYDYPQIESFYPTSASHLFYQGLHWLNTRYVNYWIHPDGCYQFQNHKRLIENKNVISRLHPYTLEPLSYKEVEERVDYPVAQDTISVGLEDLRLYTLEGRVKYIAATTGYSPHKKSRMIVGDYGLEEGVISGGKIFQPPGNIDSWCEKNWIPLVRGEKEYFIYKWSPLEIGHLDYEAGELVIDFSIPVSSPLFSKIKGSTIFHEVAEGLLGVVHFSEDHAIRHYFHLLVLLDRDTFEIKKYTEPFCFEKIGVEYCIGFTPNPDESQMIPPEAPSFTRTIPPQAKQRAPLFSQYTFWISRHDRDPLMMQIAAKEFQWL